MPRIPSSVADDNLLTRVTEDVCKEIKDKFMIKVPSNWSFSLGTRKLTYDVVREEMLNYGLSLQKIKDYYGEDSSIESDAKIIYLTINRGGDIICKPVFIGEMKKQGTNDARLQEGKPKQAQGNAGTDRVAKNYLIFSDYCYLCDKDIFPYNVFLHGCDFGNDITKTTRAKLSPLFGKLNTMHPFFDKDITWTRKGGSCFLQEKPYIYEELFDICYKCCETCIKHYMEKYTDVRL